MDYIQNKLPIPYQLPQDEFQDLIAQGALHAPTYQGKKAISTLLLWIKVAVIERID